MLSPLMMITLLVALLPTIVIMTVVILNARAAREPFRKLLIVFVVSAASVIPAAIIESIGTLVLTAAFSAAGADLTEPNGVALYQFVEYVFIVGVAEELCKYFTFRQVIFNDRDFDNTYDGVIYGACAALGFATLENLMYVFLLYSGSIGTAILRAVLSVPMHAITGIYMGYYFGITKYRRYNNLPDTHPERRALVLCILLHGVYDFLASVPGIYADTSSTLALGGFIGLAVVMIFIYVLLVRTIRKAKRESHNIYNSYYYEHLGGQYQDMRGGKTSSDGVFTPPPFYGAGGAQGGMYGAPMQNAVPPSMTTQFASNPTSSQPYQQGQAYQQNPQYQQYQPYQPSQPQPPKPADQPQFHRYVPVTAVREQSAPAPVLQKKFCGNCGAGIPAADSAKFCPICGNKLS